MDKMNATYRIAKLRGTYGNYFMPAARITVGDEVIAVGGEKRESEFAIENIQVAISVDSASSASFTVADICDPRMRGIRQNVQEVFACGTAVKVELGYGSSFEDVFHGVIYETSIQFSDLPSLQVTAMDVKRLMADNVRMDRVWDDGSVEKIFSGVMERYKWLKIKGKMEVRPEKKAGIDQIGPINQRESDLDFIKRLCRRKSLKFVVYGDQAKLIDSPNLDSMLTLAWGEDLLSFTYGRQYVNLHIEVRGHMKDEPKSDVIVEHGYVPGKGAGYEEGKATTRVVELTDVGAKADVEYKRDVEEDLAKEAMYSGSGSCMGMPVLLPGRCITLENLGKGIDGTYFLKGLTHSFGADGFTTNFTLGGKK